MHDREEDKSHFHDVSGQLTNHLLKLEMGLIAIRQRYFSAITIEVRQTEFFYSQEQS